MFVSRLLLLFNCGLIIIVGAGKMKIKILSVEDCDIPEERYDQQNKLPHAWAVSTDKNGRNYMYGYFTVERRTLPFSISLRGYKFIGSEKKLDFTIENIACSQPIIGVVLKKMELKYNAQTCVAYPGNYTSEKFTLKGLNSAFTFFSGKSLGKILFEMEFTTSKGAAICPAVTIKIEK